MITMRKLTSKLKSGFKIGVCFSIYHMTTSPLLAATTTPVLDGYAYQLFSDIEIDTSNQIISIESNMLNCEQPNGDPPADTEPYALSTNNQFIGLSRFVYNVDNNHIYFTSETNNIVCDNGVFIEIIFTGSFE